MVKRVLVGVIFVPLIIALILFAPAWAFACFAALITSFASWELLHAVAKLPTRLYVYTSLAAAILPFGFLAGRYAGVLTLGFTALALFVILFVEAIFAYDKNKEKAIRYEDVMKSLFAGILMPAFLASLVILRECGRAHVLYTIGLTFVTDAGAYFAGVLFGRHKGITQVSPHKSLEGYIGGLVIGMVFSLVYGLVLHMGWQMEVHYLALAIYGLVGALVTEIGDLSFSLIKRECGIKDYGKLLPGHGGMMDRFDSMVFCAPVIMLFYHCFPGF